MSSTLTFRITLRFAALVTATTIGVLALGGWLLDAQMQRGLVIIQQTEVTELLAKLSGTPPEPDAVRSRILHDSQGDAGLFLIQIHDHTRRVLFRSENLGSAYLPDLPTEEPGRRLTLPGVGDLYLTEIRSANWHIQVASPLSAQRRLLQDYLQVSAALAACAAVVSLGMGYGFSRTILEPLRGIARTARRIDAENLKSRIPVPKVRDEITDLGALLNAMFDRLEASFEQVRRFAGDASHELKTPLAIMRLNADKIRTRLASDPEAVAALDDWLEEQTRLSRVIDRLLFLTKAEGGALPLKLRSLNPCVLLKSVAEDAGVLADDKNVRFELGPCPTGELRGDEELLRQLVLNLVSNALHVSPPGSGVRLSAELDAAGWTLVVEDEGPGLPEAELLRIFERFVRHGHGTSADHGHGLGLAICKSIAALHGGNIRAENRADRSGLRVTVNLPG